MSAADLWSIPAVDAELTATVARTHYFAAAPELTSEVLAGLIDDARHIDELLERRSLLMWLETAELGGLWQLSWPGTEAPAWPQAVAS